MSASFSNHLPPHPGLLPKWLLLVSVISIGNSIQAYSTLTFTKKVYNGFDSASTPSRSANIPGSSPVNSLSARTFGTWTLLSSIIRLYAAYHIEDRFVYELALWTYGIAFAHFMSEWFIFGTARWGKGIAGPAVVSVLSLAWMGSQWGYYVGK